VAEQTETVLLLTVRVRYDPSFPNDRFLTLRRYTIRGDPLPEMSADVAEVGEAIRLIESWLREAPEPWR
jgi:hypothetical protein